MPAIEVKPGVFWIGVNDRTTDLFEGIWPISREGVSYNAYVINGEKKALIDLAKDFKADELLSQIAQIADPAHLDYIIINHMEPDHTGVLRTLRRVAPQAEILAAKKALDMLAHYYHITEGVRAVADREILSLGGGHTLQFHMTPFVHWPETMMTYDVESRILFSCDAFGGYGSLQGAIFDDQCNRPDFYEQEALRYYVNIVSLFPKPVLRAIDKLQGLDIDIIAPSHGLIWRERPEHIVNLYAKWASYAEEPADPGVTLLYGTMYGLTELMVEAVAEGVASAGLPVEIFDVRHTHASYVLPYLYTRRGVLVGAPTYEGGLFPPMMDMLHMAEHKRIQNRRAAYFGSYGWSGGARRDFTAIAEALKWTFDDVWEFKGAPSPQLLREGVSFGRRFAGAVLADRA
ncbi:MAG: FprA family A-type flavoprotein [Anaerolineae bacterium]|nr:FprA family A-type flavoprotein [Anaerolineae bacterium]